MKILMLTTKFSHADGSPWLISELAVELGAQGHQVRVLNVEWDRDAVIGSGLVNYSPNVYLKNYRAVQIGQGRTSLAFRWIFSSFKLWPSLFFDVLRGIKYDLVIGFSPCSALYAGVSIANFISKDSCLIYWDFFPIHNQEISRKAPRLVVPALKFLEKFLISHFSRIGCMSKKGISFFKDYFGKMDSLRVMHIPIWTSFLNSSVDSRLIVRERLGVDGDAVVLIFGGQLSAGRGIEDLCRAAARAHEVDERIILIICGDGEKLKEVLNFQSLNPSAVKYGGVLSRIEYLEFLEAADVGVVSTAGSTSSPSFPSKSLDYMACMLPIFAAVEPSSDFGEVIHEVDMGISCVSGNIEEMTNAILLIASDKNARVRMGAKGNKYLQNRHSVSRVAKLITG